MTRNMLGIQSEDISESAMPEDSSGTAMSFAESDAIPGVPRLAPRLARGVLVTVFFGFCLVGFMRVLELEAGFGQTALSVAYMLALLLLQLFHFSRPSARLRTPLGYTALLAQACLVYLPMLEFTQAWSGMAGFLAGSVLLVLPPRMGWTLFGLIVVSMGWTQVVFTNSALDIAYIAVSTVITGLVVYGLSRLASLVVALHEAQRDLARMAVSEERLRFARDLHDLLGYSLSAITLKTELTDWLVSKDPARAKEELAEILAISRQALSDVRSVASGYRALSLDAESRSVQSVLGAAGVEVRMTISHQVLPTRISTVLATVLREGVTNVLRHSDAAQCEIVVKQVGPDVCIHVVNDGVESTSAEPVGDASSGLRNLSQRVAALGGTLSAGVEQGRRFRLHASVPVGVPAARSGEDEGVLVS